MGVLEVMKMRDLNKVFLMGRLGADPIQRETKTGFPVVQFSLATSRKTRQEDEEGNDSLSEETQWHRVVVWGRQGEACAKYLRKGNPVLVEGNIRSHAYTAKDGNEKQSFEVHADAVSFIGAHGLSRDAEASVS